MWLYLVKEEGDDVLIIVFIDLFFLFVDVFFWMKNFGNVGFFLWLNVGIIRLVKISFDVVVKINL